MTFHDFWQSVVTYAQGINAWELSGLLLGLLTVYFLIKESIWTWPCGIGYVLVSFVIFWEARLYGDFLLHVFFLVLNVYGWWFWVFGNKKVQKEVLIERLSFSRAMFFLGLTAIGVFVFAQFLIKLPSLFEGVEPAALPYWDSTTSVLSITGMWLTARKKIDNWYYWFAVDVLATGIYFYKELYFYTLLYFIYIGMAVAGYLAWKKSMHQQPAAA